MRRFAQDIATPVLRILAAKAAQDLQAAWPGDEFPERGVLITKRDVAALVPILLTDIGLFLVKKVVGSFCEPFNQIQRENIPDKRVSVPQEPTSISIIGQ